MANTKSLHANKNIISASIMWVMLALISAIIFLTSTLISLPVKSVYTSAKAMGDDWATFATTYKSPNSTNTKKIVEMETLYNSLAINADAATFKHGIIDDDTTVTPNKTADYINGTGSNLAGYNYYITISTAQELLMFSTLCLGRPYGNIIGTSIETIKTFFRSANVMLANNINYSGNGLYTVKGGANALGNKDIQFGELGSVDSIKTTKSYGSNGVYPGYAAGSKVPFPFMPITDFNGCFDGQNFDILNLKILRNGKTYNTPYDAFFSSVTINGLVQNFGLSNSSFITISGLSDALTGTVNDNIVAGFCGVNKGTIKNVYNNNCSFVSDQSTYSFIGGNKNAENYYSGRAVVTGIKLGDSANSMWRGYLYEKADNTATKPTNNAGWYSAEFGDRFNNAFHDSCGNGYRRNGLKNTLAVEREQNYSINSVADFVTFLHVFKEGFTRIGQVSTVDLSTLQSKGEVYVNISCDLDFTFVNSKALIPAIDLSAIKELSYPQAKVTLYSGDIANKNNPSSTVANRKTLSNMRLNTFVEYGYDFRSYGLFASNIDAFSDSAISVYNLNFVNCNINVQSETLPTANFDYNKPTSAGIIAGVLRREVDIRYVGSNGNITADNDTNTYASNRFGGLVGSMEFIGGITPTLHTANFSNVSVNGNINSGVRNYYATNAADNNCGFFVGGILGFNDKGNINSNNNKNINYNMVSVAGNITGFMPKEYKKSNSAFASTGGLQGYGALTNIGNNLQSVYISATINNIPEYTLTAKDFKSYIGGIIGSVNGSPHSKFNALSNVLVDTAATINIKSSGTNTITCYAGGFAGSINGSEVSNFKTTDIFKGDFAVTANNTNFLLKIGNISGNATDTIIGATTYRTTANALVNDKPINISGATIGELWLGGLFGVNEGTEAIIQYCINNANVSSEVRATTVMVGGISSTAVNSIGNINNSSVSLNGSATNAGVGGIVAGCTDANTATTPTSIKDCFNFGAVTFSATGSSSATCGAGGIVGVANKGSINVNNCVNNGVISSTIINYVGGIVGNTVAGTININSALNYGEVTATTGGGILGAAKATTNISGALNYGALSAGSGGILGDNTLSKCTARQVYSYTNINKLCGSGTLTDPAPPVAQFKKESTTVSTLAYSEKPYKMTNGNYHTNSTEMPTLYYALTTTEGRRVGKYVGVNFDLAKLPTVINADSSANTTQITALKQKLADCKQIDYSTDTFNLIDNIALYDKALNQDLPATIISSTTPTTFIITINQSSKYYSDNIINANFSLLPTNIGFKKEFTDSFSASAKFDYSNPYFTGDGYNFKTDTVNPKLIATSTITVYQGDTLPTDENYKTTYTFKVYYYDAEAKFELNSVKPSSLEQTSKGGSSTGGELVMPFETSTTGEKICKPERTDAIGTLITSSWDKSTITANFILSGLDFNYIKTTLSNINNYSLYKFNDTTKGYDKDTKWKEYLFVNPTFQETGLPSLPANPELGLEEQKQYGYTLSLEVTDRLTNNKSETAVLGYYVYLTELPYGSYKFVINLPVPNKKTLVRSICFNKQKSGDVYLHIPTEKSVPRADAYQYSVFSSFTTLTNPNETSINNIIKLNINQNLSVFNANFTISGENYYGVVPALKFIDTKNKFLNFYQYKYQDVFNNNQDTYKPLILMNNATLSSPKIDLTQTNDKTLLGFTYSFTVTAENGTVQPYVHTYTYDKVPVGKNKFNRGDDTIIESNISQDVAETEAKTMTAQHTFGSTDTTNTYNINTNTKLINTNIMYSDGLHPEQQIAHFGATGGIINDTNSLNLVATDMNFEVKQTLNTVQIKFKVNTTGGTYKFVPNFKYSGELTDANTVVTNYVLTVNGNSTPRTLSLAEFGSIGQNYTINKVASKISYIRDISFDGNTPGGGMLRTWDGKTLVDFRGQTLQPNSNRMLVDYHTMSLEQNKTTINKLGLVFNFAEDGSDYSSLLNIKLGGALATDTKFYNSKDNTMYLLETTKGVTTETKIEKVPYDINGNKVAIDSAAINYYICQQYLPEGKVVNIRIRAGIPTYYKDYELVSSGPLRNKTFNITINAGAEAANCSFVATLGLQNGKSTGVIRSSSFLYNCNNGTGFYDATLTNGTYSKTYNSIFNTMGTYVINLYSFSGKFTAKITSVTVTSGNTEQLIFAPTTNKFEYKDNNSATLDIVVTITKNEAPPWGDNVFS